jgi:hypothetical protein
MDANPDRRDEVVQEIADAIREVLRKRIRLEPMEMHLMPIECAQLYTRRSSLVSAISPRRAGH